MRQSPPPSSDLHATSAVPPRVLVVGLELNRVHDLADTLSHEGLETGALTEPSLIVSRCMVKRPALVVVQQRASDVGDSIAQSLAAFAETADLPVVHVVEGGDERSAMKSFWTGAVDVFFEPFLPEHAKQLAVLVEELRERPASKVGTIDFVVEAVLRRALRLRRNGMLCLNAGDKQSGEEHWGDGQQGRAAFADGKLTWADFGPLTGTAALEEMLWTTNGSWTFVANERGRPSAPSVAKDPSLYVPTVLIADDDAELQEILVAQLETAGIDALRTSDGESALDLARHQPPDLILADLDLPRLDGWGLLRALVFDQRTRESSVAILSARDDWRETLRSARLGAVDYISKQGGLTDLLDRVRLFTTCRARAFEKLLCGDPVAVEARAEGVQWMMREAAKLGSTGSLELADTWGEYTVWVREGLPVSARSVTRRRRHSGIAAFADLLVSREASGAFRPGPVEESNEIGLPMEALLRSVCDTINRLADRELDTRLTDASGFFIDDALYALYQKIAPTPAARLAEAVCEQGLRPSEAAEQLALSPEVVHEALKELIRRGVLRLPQAN